MEDKELIAARIRGLIPGPDEDEANFLKRTGSPVLASYPLFGGISPDWIKIHFSNKGLLPWHGGFFNPEEDVPYLQLRKECQSRDKIFGIYSCKEILSHELVHAVRYRFEEPKFEEILAYQTSHVWFRRTFGALVTTKAETFIFMGILLLSGALLPSFPEFGFFLLLKIVGFFSLRTLLRQRIFEKSLSNLIKLTGSRQSALALALSLTDKEISRFSRSKPEEIKEYLKSSNLLRLRQACLFIKVD